MLNKDTYYKYINIAFSYLSLICVAHFVIIYFKQRGLWGDEAMLAKCLVTRDYWGICKGNLDYGQSSPVGYILICKFFTQIFGLSELSLRLYSVISYFGTLVFGYLISKDVLKSKFPMIAVFLLAGISVFQYFGNEFKPYMGDVFLTMTSVYLYHLYIEKRLSLICVCMFYAFFLWISFGAVFAIGGICAYHVLTSSIALYKKGYSMRQYITNNIPLIIVLISLLAYMILWVLPATGNLDEEADMYWGNLKFPLIPTSMKDIHLLVLMTKEFLVPMGRIFSFLSIIAFAFFCMRNKKHWFLQAFVLMFIFIVLASSVGLFPIILRMQLFMFALFIVAVSNTICWFFENIALNKLTLAIICCCLVLSTLPCKSAYMWNNESFVQRYDVKRSIDMVRMHDSESVIYLLESHKPTVEFYTSYKSDVGNLESEEIYETDGFIWGTKVRYLAESIPYEYNYQPDISRLKLNIDCIQKYRTVYVLSGACEDFLINGLEQAGSKVSIFYKDKYNTIFKIDSEK